MKHDPLNDAISMLKNYERAGKDECILNPSSRMLQKVLQVFQSEGYIGEFEVSNDVRGGNIRVRLVKKINNCGIIKPRFPVKHDDFITWEKRYLPARGFGVLIVTTPQGLMSHNEAKEKGLGGRLIAYVY